MAAQQGHKDMQVTQSKSEGLSRQFDITITAKELEEKLSQRIDEIRPQMNLKGFRPGKVPASHVRKMYGKDLMGELINKMVDETNQKVLEDNDLRPAGQPNVHFEGDMEPVLAGQADLSYHMHVDVMPEFEPMDVTKLTIERPVAKIEDSEIDEAIGRIAEQNTQYEARGKTAKAKEGDAVVVDFLGKVDGEPFEGGKAEDTAVVIGAGRFIPGFEEQLEGVKTGDETEITVTFPDDYPSQELAGKEAVFEIKVKEVKAPKTPEIDDEFAKGLGLEGLDQLKDMITEQLQAEYKGASRNKAKRALLDALDEAHAFDLPPNMVEQEFEQIWQQLEQEKAAGNLSEEDMKKSDDELKEEYRKIAERRVRLGLVLAEIGRANEIQISEQDVQQVLIAEARNYPGQEREVIEFFQKTPGAMAQIRAPIYEDKVVDFILETATVKEKTVSKDELFAEEDE